MDLLFIANINNFLKGSLRSELLSCFCLCLCAFWFIPCPTCTGQAVGPSSVIRKLNGRQVQCDWTHHVPWPKMCVVFATVASLHLSFLKLSENLAIPTSPAAWNMSVHSSSSLPWPCSEHQVCIDPNSGSSSNKASHHIVGLVLSPSGRSPA